MYFNFLEKAGGYIYLYDKTFILQEIHLFGETHVTPRPSRMLLKGALFFQKGPHLDQKGGLKTPQDFYKKIVII